MAGLMPKEQAAGPDDATKAFTANVINLIYDQKSFPNLLQSLKATAGQKSDGAKTNSIQNHIAGPVATLAHLAAVMVMRVEDSAEQNGVTVPKAAVFQAGYITLFDLANLSSAAGGHTFSDDEIKQAIFRAVNEYRTVRQSQGKIDQNAAKADLAAMQQAQESGTLDQKYPGMSRAAEMFGGMSGQGGPDQGEAEAETPPETAAEGGQEEPGDAKTNGQPSQEVIPTENPQKDRLNSSQGSFNRPGRRIKAKRKKGK